MEASNYNIASLPPEQLQAIKDFEHDFTSKYGNSVFLIAYQSH